MPESYSLFPYFCSTVLVDPFDPYSPFKFLIFIVLVCWLFIGHYNNHSGAYLLFYSYKSLHGMLRVSSMLSEGILCYGFKATILKYYACAYTHVVAIPLHKKAQHQLTSHPLTSHPLLHYLTTIYLTTINNI